MDRSPLGHHTGRHYSLITRYTDPLPLMCVMMLWFTQVVREIEERLYEHCQQAMQEAEEGLKKGLFSPN